MNKLRHLRTDLTGLWASKPEHMSDKMGPWYHPFGLLFVGGIQRSLEGYGLGFVENASRYWPWQPSPVDPFKMDVNFTFGKLAFSLNTLVNEHLEIPEDLESMPYEKVQNLLAEIEEYSTVFGMGISWLNRFLSQALASSIDSWVEPLKGEVKSERARVKAELDARQPHDMVLVVPEPRHFDRGDEVEFVLLFTTKLRPGRSLGVEILHQLVGTRGVFAELSESLSLGAGDHRRPFSWTVPDPFPLGDYRYRVTIKIHDGPGFEPTEEFTIRYPVLRVDDIAVNPDPASAGEELRIAAAYEVRGLTEGEEIEVTEEFRLDGRPLAAAVIERRANSSPFYYPTLAVTLPSDIADGAHTLVFEVRSATRGSDDEVLRFVVGTGLGGVRVEMVPPPTAPLVANDARELVTHFELRNVTGGPLAVIIHHNVEGPSVAYQRDTQTVGEGAHVSSVAWTVPGDLVRGDYTYRGTVEMPDGTRQSATTGFRYWPRLLEIDELIARPENAHPGDEIVVRGQYQVLGLPPDESVSVLEVLTVEGTPLRFERAIDRDSPSGPHFIRWPIPAGGLPMGEHRVRLVVTAPAIPAERDEETTLVRLGRVRVRGAEVVPPIVVLPGDVTLRVSYDLIDRAATGPIAVEELHHIDEILRAGPVAQSWPATTGYVAAERVRIESGEARGTRRYRGLVRAVGEAGESGEAEFLAVQVQFPRFYTAGDSTGGTPTTSYERGDSAYFAAEVEVDAGGEEIELDGELILSLFPPTGGAELVRRKWGKLHPGNQVLVSHPLVLESARVGEWRARVSLTVQGQRVLGPGEITFEVTEEEAVRAVLPIEVVPDPVSSDLLTYATTGQVFYARIDARSIPAGVEVGEVFWHLVTPTGHKVPRGSTPVGPAGFTWRLRAREDSVAGRYKIRARIATSDGVYGARGAVFVLEEVIEGRIVIEPLDVKGGPTARVFASGDLIGLRITELSPEATGQGVLEREWQLTLPDGSTRDLPGEGDQISLTIQEGDPIGAWRVQHRLRTETHIYLCDTQFEVFRPGEIEIIPSTDRPRRGVAFSYRIPVPGGYSAPFRTEVLEHQNCRVVANGAGGNLTVPDADRFRIELRFIDEAGYWSTGSLAGAVPFVKILAPASGTTVTTPVVTVTGEAVNIEGDRITLNVNGSPRQVSLSGERFSSQVPLLRGDNQLQAEAGELRSNVVLIKADIPPTDIWTELTWDGPGDIDFHLYLPNGEHCFYGKKRVPAGASLDIDNTHAHGPEHIVMERAIPGPYRLTVLYFSNRGGDPVRAVRWNVTVRFRDDRVGQSFSGVLREKKEEQTVKTFAWP